MNVVTKGLIFATQLYHDLVQQKIALNHVVHTFLNKVQQNCGSVRELNTLDTNCQCITGLHVVSALEQLSNGRGWIMHKPKASALSTLDRYLIVLVC